MENPRDGTSSLPVRNIIILGATGNIGTAILTAFQTYNASHLTSPFKLTVLTRTASYAKTVAQLSSAADVQVLSIDTYTNSTALSTMLQDHNIEVLISTIASFSTNDQAHLISACISSGTVRRFFPSEYGVDTSNRALLEKHLPLGLLKYETIDLLRQASTSTYKKLTWTAIITGAFFDWSLALPGVLAYDVPNMRVNVFDGGNISYEATNVHTIGNAVVACLTSDSRFEDTADQYVYINSFTTTQNQVISLVEKYTNRSMTRNPINAKELSERALATIEANGGLQACRDYDPTPEKPYAPGSGESIWACIFGGEAAGGLNLYSMREPGLWNDRLGLPKEDIEETIRGVVEKLSMLQA